MFAVAWKEWHEFKSGIRLYLVLILSLLPAASIAVILEFIAAENEANEILRDPEVLFNLNFIFMLQLWYVVSLMLSVDIMSNENELGTLSLLLTKPLSESDIVFGKFLTLTGMLSVISFIPPVLLDLIIEIELGESVSFWYVIFAGLVALFFNATVVAITMAFSSLTKRAFVSAIGTSMFFVITVAIIPIINFLYLEKEWLDYFSIVENSIFYMFEVYVFTRTEITFELAQGLMRAFIQLNIMALFLILTIQILKMRRAGGL